MTDKPVPAFGAPAAAALVPVAGEVKEVRQKAEVGGLTLDREAADAMLRRLAALKRRTQQLVTDSGNLDTPLRFGDNWVGELMSQRLRTVAADRRAGVISVLTAFSKVLTDLEYTIKAASDQYFTTDEESADMFRNSLHRLGLEAAE
jgi:hypothetical protein